MPILKKKKKFSSEKCISYWFSFSEELWETLRGTDLVWEVVLQEWNINDEFSELVLEYLELVL